MTVDLKMKTLRMDLPFSLFLLSFCLFEAHGAMVSNAPEVRVNNTRFVGHYTRQGLHLVSTYLGIPYATPPVGPLRFQKTVPLQSLPPVINAASFKPDCFSTTPSHQQSEDCLYLNVWVPAGATAPLPVMVWIHGGGFIAGSSNSPQGTVLAAENQVIVVSLNYRLGALGFLSTEDEASRGNYGLWDQHTGLQWVRDHIGSFGGDPGRITIFGESAGGKSVSFQVVSPYSGHLFQRAIIQSGTVLCPTALQWKPVETAVRLARAVGCPSGDNHQLLLQCLRLRTAFQIASASSELWADDVLRYLIDFGWGPVEDGDFVPKLYHPDGTPTPLSPTFTGSLMLGSNNNEGALLKIWRIPATYHLDHDIEDELHDPRFFTDDFLPKVLAQMFKTLPENTPTFATASQVVSALYTNGNPDSYIKSRDLYDTFGDQAYVSPTFHFLEQWLNTTQFREKAFVYVFDNYPGVPVEEGLEGMKHGDDVPYTFGTIEQKLQSMGMASDLVAREARLSQNFRKLLTNFAKTGNPASPMPLDPNWPTWPAYDVQQQKYLSVSSTPAVSDHYRVNYMTLWNHRVPSIVNCDTAGSGTSSLNTCSREDLIG